MAKELISQKLKMTCDACKYTREWELVGADEDPNILQEMSQWFTISRKVVDPQGLLGEIGGHAHSPECAAVLAVKFSAIPSQEPSNKIDLSSLKVN